VKKVKFDYVISAINMMNVHRKHYYESPEKVAIYKQTLKDLVSVVNNTLTSELTHIDNGISILFNAFTEGNALECYDQIGRLSADLVYADSGGLQIVTAGKSITAELKDQVYNIQSGADRAMCFDVIALDSVSTVRTKTERSNVSNKIFGSSRHLESGAATGRNILRQCEIFDRNDSNAKVMVIVQGNRADDMVGFFNEIQKLIPEDYMRFIGGIALADTCMGNGDLESVEMLKAGHIIANEFDPIYSQHLHLLGVGSVSRMKPVMYLSKSNFLDSFSRISYDSTSHSGTLLFGRWFVGGKQRPIGNALGPTGRKAFNDIWNFFESILSPLCTKEEFFQFAFGPGLDEALRTTTIANRSKDMSLEHFAACASLTVMYVYYQIYDFIKQLDAAWRDSENDKTPIGYLQECKTMDDLDAWFRDRSSTVNSNRIAREDEISTLEAFFG
jgi:hypothetical protein